MNWLIEGAWNGRRMAVAAGVLAGHALLLAHLGPSRGMHPAGAGRGTVVVPLQAVMVQPPAASMGRPLSPEPGTWTARAAAAEDVPPPQPAGHDGATTALATYLPRSALSVPPVPLEPVGVVFPPEVEGRVDLRVEVSLFIDEQGVVRRVRVDTPHVHWAFESAVHEAFGKAMFVPGRLGEEPVRSWIRVEVVFDAGARRTIS